MVSQRIGPACAAGAIVVLSVLAVAQAPRPSIIVQAATPPPQRNIRSLMFPDRIDYDNRTERYEFRHASRSSGRFPGAETVLYIRRADLIEAFARARGIAPTVPGLSRPNQRLQPAPSAVSSR